MDGIVSLGPAERKKLMEMYRRHPDPAVRRRAHIVLLLADGATTEKFRFLENEPLLSAFCQAELLQALGKLALSGASPAVVRGVGADIHRLITVTALAMRAGYCSLLEDFLPEFVTSPPEKTPHATEEDRTEP